MPQISVIIPVYNTEKYLTECLDSVLTQTFSDIEIICVNDGSPDNSGKILTEYKKKDTRIKVIAQRNQGLAAARNTGLRQTTGRFICFLDSDDTLPVYALKTLYDIAIKTEAPIVASRAFGKTNTLNTNSVLHTKNVFRDFVHDRKIFSSAANKLYQKNVFKTQRFYKGMLFEDWPVMTILFSQIKCYATTETPCYIYREDNTSITRSAFSDKKIDSYMHGIQIVYDYFKDSSLLPIAQKRMAVAIKMCVNKVYHTHNKALSKHLLVRTTELFTRRIIRKQQLSFKTLWRLWLLKHL